MMTSDTVQIVWEDENQSCIKLILHQMPSYQVVSSAFATAQTSIQSVSHPVDLMIVVKSNDMPAGFIHAAKQAEEHVPQNVNRIVMVGGQQLTFQMIHQFMSQYRPSERLQQRFFFCETEAEARALLAHGPQHLDRKG